jgi:hypothetical protein
VRGLASAKNVADVPGAGTTLIVAPQADADAIHAAIPGSRSDGQGGFTIPCTSTATVALVMGGKSFAINPVDLAFLPLDLNELKGDCTSGISAGQIGGAGQWLVGDGAACRLSRCRPAKRNLAQCSSRTTTLRPTSPMTSSVSLPQSDPGARADPPAAPSAGAAGHPAVLIA